MKFNQLYDLHLNNPYKEGLIRNANKKYRRIKYYKEFELRPIVNFWWSKTGKYFKEKGFKEIKVYEHKYTINWEEEIKDGGGYLDYSDCHIVYIHTSLSTCFEPKIEFSLGVRNRERYSFWPRTNREITKESIIDEVHKYIEKVVFYPINSEFGAIQLLYGINKEQLKERIKKRNLMATTPNSEREAIRAIRRKYGYTTSDWVDPEDFVSTAIRLYKQRGKGKNKEVSNVRVDLDFDFDGDIDEAENMFYDAYSEATKGKENQILILT